MVTRHRELASAKHRFGLPNFRNFAEQSLQFSVPGFLFQTSLYNIYNKYLFLNWLA